jgi:2-desacetyl-2-hydroxyethyl bacteriochlorophyllide A dehydrogenase
MKTIVLEEPGRLQRTETEPPTGPGEGEVIVRVRQVGICGTDLHAFEGTQPFFSYPRILGHELGVEVVEVGKGVVDVGPGDRAAVEPYLECGECQACRRGRSNCCDRLKLIGVHVDGGMRELIRVPAEKLHISQSLELEQLALVEMLAIGSHAVQRSGLMEGETALVVGAGPIGLAVIEFARLAGARVLAMELDEHRQKLCREGFGVECVGGGEEGLAAVREVLGGELPTVVFEATGSPAAMETAFGYVAQAGRLVLVGFVQADIRFHDPEFHRREMTLLSSRNALKEDFARILPLLEGGQIDAQAWITHRAGYGDVIERFSTWLDPQERALKVVLEM